MNKKITPGFNVTAYEGVDQEAVPGVITVKRDPRTTDRSDYFIGFLWVNPVNDTIWILVDLRGGIATWIQLGTSSSGTLNFVTDSGTATVANNSINWFGNTESTTTTGVSDTVSNILKNGSDGQVLIGGGAAPTWANITSSDGSITIANGPNTIDLSISNAGQLDEIVTDSGTVEPFGDVIEMFGDGNVISTSGSGNTVTITLDNGTNGQVLIGGGSDPTWANITGSGSISVTNGANTINVEAASAVPTSFVTDSGTAVPAGNIINWLGGASTGIATTGSADYLGIGITQYAGIVTFEPTVTTFGGGSTTPGGVTYGTRYGYYSRIGTNVLLNLYIEITSVGSGGSGAMKIVGPNIGITNVTALNARVSNLTLPLGHGVNCFSVGSANFIVLTEPPASSVTYVQWSRITAGTVIHISGIGV